MPRSMIYEFDRELDPDRLTYGDRVRMSPLGLERHPSYGAREGVIVGMGSPNSMRVKFDDRVTVQAIHRDYLVRVANAKQQTNQTRRAS
ncbi:hypothetical protein [Tardiphaga sp.]|jgi:hypothetical protein|uniref:hypothetical protein n=1 Tax=Tardiphaga sp. TaxID=1926292 RepID=UPI0037DA4FDB